LAFPQDEFRSFNIVTLYVRKREVGQEDNKFMRLAIPASPRRGFTRLVDEISSNRHDHVMHIHIEA
jgi:hypothetical protein